MKFLILLLVSVLFLSLTASGEGITRSPEGLIQVEEQKFGIAFWEQNWKTSASQLLKPEIVTFPGEEGIKTPEGIRRDGTFRISDRYEFHLTETFLRKKPEELLLHLTLSSETGIPSAILCWHTLIPDALYAKAPALYNGKSIPCERKKQLVQCKSTGNDTLILNLKQGRLVITGTFQLTVRRNEWGFTELRLSFSHPWGKIRRSDLKVHLNYTPYASHPINLRKAVNMGFRDEFPGDGKGGWTDQGPQNDLRAMTSGTQTMGGIPFDIIDPAANQGRSCLAMRGTHRPYFLEKARIAFPGVAGKYLYLLNAMAWLPGGKKISCGAVRIGYEDGTEQTQELISGIDTADFWNPSNLKNGIVVWKNSNGEANIGLYATKIPLQEEKKVVSLEILSRGQVWMIPAATISDREIERKNTIIRTVIRADKNWKPVSFGYQTHPGSVADLTFLIKPGAPAGKFGFLKYKGDQFEFEKQPGVPVRFWGKCMGFRTLFQSGEKTLAMLDEEAALGTNAIRLHHFDNSLTHGKLERGSFHPENLRKLDFLVAEAKKRGIYITLDLFTFRHYDVMQKLGNPSMTDYKVLCYFDEQARAGLLGFAEELFLHVNPYTGTAWKDEPAIITLNLINEGTLPALLPRTGKRVRELVDKAFQKYAAERKITITDQNRGDVHARFLADTGKQFFHKVKGKLNTLGVKVLFSDQNFAQTALDTRNVYDYVDSHFYFCHPVSLSGTNAPPTFYGSRSPIRGYSAGLRDIALTRIIGKPMTITEWNYCWPNPHFFEGPFLTGAYAALQDYNGLCFLASAFEHAHTGRLSEFNSSNNAVMRLALRAGALLYLRGDVKTSIRPIAATVEGGKKAGPFLQLVSKFGIRHPPYPKEGILIASPDEKISHPALVTGRNPEEFLKKLKQKKYIAENALSLKQKTAVSDTGELFLDAANEIFSAVTERAEVLLLPGKREAKGNVLRVRNGSAHAAFFAGALDGLPLPKSGRIMILHLTNLSNEGTVFRNADQSILEKQGTNQQLLYRNKAEMELAVTGKTYTLFACDPNGKRLFQHPFRKTEKTLSFTADNNEKSGILLYELIRTENEQISRKTG